MNDVKNLDFNKLDKVSNLIPAIIQDYYTQDVLMLGFMDKEALEKTLQTGLVTFFSRTKGRIWTKGEESGNHLQLKTISVDCDNDTLLIQALPTGSTCHKGTKTCFTDGQTVFNRLIEIICDRHKNPKVGSYTNKLFDEGVKRIAQKVGEEGLEVALAAVDCDNKSDKTELINETADLLYHILVLLQHQSVKIDEVMKVLELRIK